MGKISKLFATRADLYGPLAGLNPDDVCICVDREGTDKQQQIPMTIEMALYLQESLAAAISDALKKRMDFHAPEDPDDREPGDS